jgi:hypothetical protein
MTSGRASGGPGRAEASSFGTVKVIDAGVLSPDPPIRFQ